jgi:hypothetical protein
MVYSMLIGLTRKPSSIDIAGSKFLSYPERPDRSGAQPVPSSCVPGTLSSEINLTTHLELKCIENVLSYKSTLVHFHGVVLVNHRETKHFTRQIMFVYRYKLDK